jgi:hypothetical protein
MSRVWVRPGKVIPGLGRDARVSERAGVYRIVVLVEMVAGAMALVGSAGSASVRVVSFL